MSTFTYVIEDSRFLVYGDSTKLAHVNEAMEKLRILRQALIDKPASIEKKPDYEELIRESDLIAYFERTMTFSRSKNTAGRIWRAVGQLRNDRSGARPLKFFVGVTPDQIREQRVGVPVLARWRDFLASKGATLEDVVP